MTEPRLKTLIGVIMNPTTHGANEFTVDELEELFRDDEAQQETPPATGTENPQEDDKNDVTSTQTFARRLKESTDKARKEERENIAKSLGYESYDDMQKKRERELLDSKGLDAEDVSPVIDEIVKQRLDNDPRMARLAELEAKQVKEFGKQELAEINKLTGGKITSLSQLPREVVDLWAKKGSLVKAYMEVEGVNLVNSIRSEQSKGTTEHLANPSGGVPATPTKRHLTAEEKAMWKAFHPQMTDEELNKKMIDV